MASKRSGARKVNFSNSKAELIHFSFDKRCVTSANKMNVSLDNGHLPKGKFEDCMLFK